MKNKKTLLTTLILFLVLIEASTLFLMYKSYSGKETNLDEVNLQENLTNEMFAIMLEQDDGTYKESSDNTWPTSGYTYNASMSGCIDVNGNKLDGVLTYDATNNIATVDTGNTSYCYLYFSLPPNLYELCNNYSDINACVQNANLEDVSGIWNSILEDDGYRYIGENPNNYVCFGTTDTNECIGDTDLYSYRIIGFFEDNSGVNHIKLIKKEALNEKYLWSRFLAELNYDESEINWGLNGSYYLTNSAYPYMQENSWLNKISEWSYTIQGTSSYGTGINEPNYLYTSVRAIYLHEMNRDSKTDQSCYYSSSATVDCSVGEWLTSTTKIGLMYVSDYLLSLGSNALDYKVGNNFRGSWIRLGNNDSAPPAVGEWTMSRMGAVDKAYHYSSNTGGLDATQTGNSNSARPVFYLISDVKITGGDGSPSNPYIIG